MTTLSSYEKILVALFLLSLPMLNPWVRGDGVGYYAFVRAPLIQHNLDFRQDWFHANTSFRLGRTDDSGTIPPEQFTATGHLDNHFSIGPAILWAPFVVAAHAGVLIADALGAHVSADGFSRPYLWAMAFGTALYGFLSLWISFRIARSYMDELWAFFGVLGIWFASSLPVYMYFNPSWSHAQSAFMVALFLWYWLRTLGTRNFRQWVILGAISGLMMDVYYINAVLVLFPFAESIAIYHRSFKSQQFPIAERAILNDVGFSLALLVLFFPTLLSKKIVYGGYFDFGYKVHWYWSSPAFLKTAFSSDHGYLVWTPILIISIIGIVLFARRERIVGFGCIAVLLLYTYAIGCYSDWDGLSSFGNRFFVSLTALFLLGLAAFFNWLADALPAGRVVWAASAITVAFVVINVGLIFQWGMHLIPVRGPISFSRAAYNEVMVVPGMAAGTLKNYFTARSGLMGRIEQEDLRQLKATEAVAP